MLRVDADQFQSNFPFYMKQAMQGEEIVIAQSDMPDLLLSAYASKKQRQLGAWKNKVQMAEDFDSMPSELKPYFS